MKLIKNTFFIGMLFIALILTGCGKNDEKLFNETFNNMNEANNFEMIMNMEVVASEINIETEMEMEFDMGSETEGVVKYALSIDGTTLNGYINMYDEKATNYINIMGTWVKTTQSLDEYKNESDTSGEFINALKEHSSYKVLKDETLSDGTKVKVYEFTLDAPNLLEDVFDDQANSMSFGLTKAELEKYLSDITYKISIDTEEKLVRKIEIDMKPIFDKIVEAAKEKDSSIKVEFTKANLTFEYNNYGKVEVTIPNNVVNNAIDGSNLFG